MTERIAKTDLSREYLEEAMAEAKQWMPGWAWALLHKRAFPRAGAKARRRPADAPTPIEKIGLLEIRPSTLRPLPDDELRSVWTKLGEMFTAGKKAGDAIENIVNAALWTADELDRRQLKVDDSELAKAVEGLRAVRKKAGDSFDIQALPTDLVVVPSFVSAVGSALGHGDDNPGDLDIVVRAPWRDDGQLELQAENVWLPLRNAMDPDKTGKLHWIGNPQGPHGDHLPLYDLVLRRRDKAKTEIVKQGPEQSKRGLTEGETRSLVEDRGRRFAKPQANYQDPAPEDASLCRDCRFYVSRTTAAGVCQVVAGQIGAVANCDLWLSSRKTEQPEEIVKESTPPEGHHVQVASEGPRDAPIAFVGASPSRLEAARQEPFVGDAGQVLAKQYLEPMKLKRADVALVNAVPQLLRGEDGRARQPNTEEISLWQEWLHDELDRLAPGEIVAFGKKAADALGDRASIMVPHPSAVRMFPDRYQGELARKLRRLQKQMAEQVAKQAELGEEGGGETRGEDARKQWEKTWHEQLPESGKGRFVYQHHWRGIDQEEGEDKLDDAALLKTGRSLHGDLRLEGEDGLWGFTIFLGPTNKNRGAKGDRLFSLAGDDKLQASNKLPQPELWLDIGVKKPLLVEPGGVGATSQKAAKFFAKDRGKYELGVVRKNSAEIFLDGKGLKGRYLVTFAPVAGRRIWLISKPEDQTPMADQRDKEDLIKELRAKRQKFLVWSKPGQRPETIDVSTGDAVAKSALMPIVKADADKRIIYAVVLDPYQFDTHQDWIPPHEIEETAHRWFAESRLVSLQHKGPTASYAVESWVEAYPSKQDYRAAMAEEPHQAYRRKFGSDTIHSGAWIIGTKLCDADWEKYEDGEIDAYSVEGFGRREKVSRSAMPKVNFVDLVRADGPTKAKARP